MFRIPYWAQAMEEQFCVPGQTCLPTESGTGTRDISRADRLVLEGARAPIMHPCFTIIELGNQLDNMAPTNKDASYSKGDTSDGLLLSKLKCDGGPARSQWDSLLRNLSVCPITFEVMLDPVMDPHGFTYERTALYNALKRRPGVCPLTNEPYGPNFHNFVPISNRIARDLANFVDGTPLILQKKAETLPHYSNLSFDHLFSQASKAARVHIEVEQTQHELQQPDLQVVRPNFAKLLCLCQLIPGIAFIICFAVYALHAREREA